VSRSFSDAIKEDWRRAVLFAGVCLAALIALPGAANAHQAYPYFIEPPAWWTEAPGGPTPSCTNYQSYVHNDYQEAEDFQLATLCTAEYPEGHCEPGQPGEIYPFTSVWGCIHYYGVRSHNHVYEEPPPLPFEVPVGVITPLGPGVYDTWRWEERVYVDLHLDSLGNPRWTCKREASDSSGDTGWRGNTSLGISDGDCRDSLSDPPTDSAPPEEGIPPIGVDPNDDEADWQSVMVCKAGGGIPYCVFRFICPHPEGRCRGSHKVTAPDDIAGMVKGKNSLAKQGQITLAKGNVDVAAGESVELERELTGKGKQLYEAATTGKNRRKRFKGRFILGGKQPLKRKIVLKLK
jgi:hypothetical protein